MKWAWSIVAASVLLVTSADAQAQLTAKCAGETWVDLAERRYKDVRYGPLLAHFNKSPDTERCKKGKFIRFLASIDHEVRDGQTIRAIAARFLRGKGGAKLIRWLNEIGSFQQAEAGEFLRIPAELKLTLADPPSDTLALLDGLIDDPRLRAYNGMSAKKKWRAGQTVFVPLFPGGGALQPVAQAAPEAAVVPSRPNATQPAEPPTTVPRTRRPDAGVIDAGKAPEDIERDPNETISVQPDAPIKPITQRRNVSGPAARMDQFPHALHKEALGKDWQCNVCHFNDPRRQGRYLEVPTALCGQCHAKVDSTRDEIRFNRLPLMFDHNQHLNPAGKARTEYGDIDCDSCHGVASKGRRGNPGHIECGKCHNASEHRVVVSRDCSACHGEVEQTDRLLAAKALLATHLAQSIRGNNVKFNHDSHVPHVTEGDLGCDRCHVGAREATTVDAIEPQRMADCLECHRGLQKVVQDTLQDLDACATCHFTRSTATKPTFEAVVEKPTSHTMFFRRNHGAQAESDKGLCQACHPPLAGEPAAECNRCHSTMRPSDHFVRWREERHGRAAVRDPERCATCHLQDRCVDCHSVRPRDHFPRGTFLNGGHARPARISMRRCQTCHLPEVDCAACHDVANR